MILYIVAITLNYIVYANVEENIKEIEYKYTPQLKLKRIIKGGNGNWIWQEREC